MGDRCYLQVEVLREHFEKFKEIVGDVVLCGDLSDYADNEKIITITDDQVNYGAYNELVKAAEEGCTFSGFHGVGGEYDATGFVGFEGRHFEIAQSCMSDDSFVRFNVLDGTVDEDSLADAVEYSKAWKAVYDLFRQIRESEKKNEVSTVPEREQEEHSSP